MKINLGCQIDYLFKLERERKEADAVVKKIEERIDEAEKLLIVSLDAEGTTRGAGKHASAAITESVVPSVIDWDSFYSYIHKNKYYHLLERRPSVTGCRELFETKGKVPGVVPFTKRKLTCKPL